ncbi:E3 ubiquitin-protein ligase PUB23-like [Hibiscus syriacus]|uniref:U-box domain-containing protein n=1 Tax=Hibiscus syriacus TaxID=106335 RepID=A0A6A2YZC4_HIBSY|nr:E3 ubiquitin-protein ligase PUB23-like [Hibiscus syriacus]KAE8684954.1 E3 ubiquitin-protein ligase PUB23-like [Hibiscus syriacus]
MEKIDCPEDFRCPISREIMKDPVTIVTGVSYERKNIDKWFNVYNKRSCPATMQPLHSFDTTPNHTLKRLILAWRETLVDAPSSSSSSPAQPSIKHDEMVSLFSTLDSSPFKVSSLKEIRAIVESGDDMRSEFIRSGGVEAVVRMLVSQSTVDNCDLVSFQACEEALSLLHVLPLSKQEEAFELLSKPEPMRSTAVVLQRGSAEARFHAIIIFRKIAKAGFDWNPLLEDRGIGLLKSLLELVYDEICSKASSYALEVLFEVVSLSKKSRLKAIEAGAVCVLIELLPDSNRSKCEKMLLVMKLLCECPEGRAALVDHGLGIAVVSNKLLGISNAATKLGVKILYLVSNHHPTERVSEEMLMYGAVKKLVTLLHLEGRCSTQKKVLDMLKVHGNSWRRHQCFPCDLKDYLS